ncbi:MAG: TVP38/TMEM64 family protein [bacterium]|nr:TVP38/TMEM64 family protein [bacterium]
MGKDKCKFLIFIFAFVIIITFSFYFDLHKRISVLAIENFIKDLGHLGPLIYMVSYAFTSIILFPASLLSTASGVVWGEYIGTVYTVIGATISASFPFLISRHLGREFVQRKMKGTKLDLCDKLISKNGFLAVLIMRLIPIFPWDVVNYSSGLCDIKIRDYLLATLIGTIPGSFTYNLIGASLGKPIDKLRIIFIFTMVACMVLGALIYKAKYKKLD